MRIVPTLVVATGFLALAGCYSSSEQIGADDSRTPSTATSGKAAGGQGGESANAPSAAVPGPAPSSPAQPDGTTGNAAASAPTPDAAPSTQPPR